MRKLALALALLATPAQAQMLLTGVSNESAGTSSFVGTADAAGSAPIAFWGMRAMSTATAAAGTQKLFQLTKTGATCDILVANNGGPGLTTACTGTGTNGVNIATFCSTACTFSAWYDQTGNGQDLFQATVANQPIYTTNCVGTFSCAQGDAARELDRNPLTTQNQPFTISAFAERTGAFTTAGTVFAGNGFDVQLLFDSTANNIFMYAGNSTNTMTTADSAPHSLIAVYNGSTSGAVIDGTPPTACFGGGVFACNASTNGISGASALITNSGNPSNHPFTGYVFELGIWNGGWTTTQWTPVSANQCNYWTGNSTCAIGGTPKTFVQTIGNTNATTCSTCTLATLGAAVGVGNVVVGAMLINDNSTPSTVLTGVTDDKGNTYNIGTRIRDAGTGLSQQLFWRGNITNGPTVFTGTYSANIIAVLTKVTEYSGAATLTDPSDGTTGQEQSPPPATTDAVTSTNITTTVANDLIWGVSSSMSGTLSTVGTGFTGRGNQANYLLVEDKNLVTAGTTAATYTWGGSGNTITQVIAIK